jgi:hypothetical protein
VVENRILGEMRHHRIYIVSVEGIADRIKEFERDRFGVGCCSNCGLRHCGVPSVHLSDALGRIVGQTT